MRKVTTVNINPILENKENLERGIQVNEIYHAAFSLEAYMKLVTLIAVVEFDDGCEELVEDFSSDITDTNDPRYMG